MWRVFVIDLFVRGRQWQTSQRSLPNVAMRCFVDVYVDLYLELTQCRSSHINIPEEGKDATLLVEHRYIRDTRLPAKCIEYVNECITAPVTRTKTCRYPGFDL